MVWLNAAKAEMLQPNERQVWAGSLDWTIAPLDSLTQMLTVRLVNNCKDVDLIADV